MTRSRLVIGLGLLLAFGLPELHLGLYLAPGDSLKARLLREASWWAIGACMLAYVLLVERRPLSSIGLRRPDFKTVVIAVPAAVVMLASVVLSYAVIFPLLHLHVNQAAVARVSANPTWLITAMVARAGVVEEILYRGYPIERIQELTDSKWIAASIAVVVFVAAHYSSWGSEQLIVVLFGAVLLALLYLWRRDLVCNMVAHFVVDLVGFLASTSH